MMTKRVKHGVQLIHQSLKVIRNNKKLIVFPFLSSVLILILMAFLFTPLINYEKSQLLLQKNQTHVIIWAYVILFLFLFVIHQITIHLNAALTHCTKEHFLKKPIRLKEGFSAANARFFKLYLWNLYGGTAGIFLNLFQFLLKNLPFYKKMFCGLRWKIATYFTIPIIMSENLGPVKTIKRSAQLIHDTWGSNLRTNFGFLPLLLLARFLSLFPMILGLVEGSRRGIIIGTSITVVFIIITTMISSAVQTILSYTLYRYAEEKIIPEEFSETLIKKAFVERET